MTKSRKFPNCATTNGIFIWLSNIFEKDMKYLNSYLLRKLVVLWDIKMTAFYIHLRHQGLEQDTALVPLPTVGWGTSSVPNSMDGCPIQHWTHQGRPGAVGWRHNGSWTSGVHLSDIDVLHLLRCGEQYRRQEVTKPRQQQSINHNHR